MVYNIYFIVFVSAAAMVYIFTKVEGDYYEECIGGYRFKHNAKKRAKEGKVFNDKK